MYPILNGLYIVFDSQVEDLTEIPLNGKHIGSLVNYALFKLQFPHTNWRIFFPSWIPEHAASWLNFKVISLDV